MSWSKDSDGGKPKFLIPSDRDDVSLYSPDMLNKQRGIKSPGWIYYKELEKENGSIKRFVEPIWCCHTR